MWRSATGQPLFRCKVEFSGKGLGSSLKPYHRPPSQSALNINVKRQRSCAALHGEMGQTLQLSSNATFVIVVFAIALMIFVGVVSYIFFRNLSGRKRRASSDTFFTFNNNHRKSHIFMFTDDDSSLPPAVPDHTGFYPRNSLINSESKFFTSIKISPLSPSCLWS